MEPAGLDEDQRLADRRPADRRPADLRRLRRYLVKFVQAYTDGRGADLRADACRTSRRTAPPTATPAPTCRSRQAVRGHRAARPRPAAAGLDTKILGYDHNWSEHPNDIANTPPGEDPETEYPTLLLQSAAGRWLAGTAYHCYAGDQTRMTAAPPRVPRQGRSGSPSARARTAPATRRPRSSATPSRGTPATSPSACRATGRRRRQLEPRPAVRTAGRTTAAATPAPAWSPSTTTTPSPATPSTTRSGTSPGSCSPAPAGRQLVVRHDRLERHGRWTPPS